MKNILVLRWIVWVNWISVIKSIYLYSTRNPPKSPFFKGGPRCIHKFPPFIKWGKGGFFNVHIQNNIQNTFAGQYYNLTYPYKIAKSQYIILLWETLSSLRFCGEQPSLRFFSLFTWQWLELLLHLLNFYHQFYIFRYRQKAIYGHLLIVAE